MLGIRVRYQKLYTGSPSNHAEIYISYSEQEKTILTLGESSVFSANYEFSAGIAFDSIVERACQQNPSLKYCIDKRVQSNGSAFTAASESGPLTTGKVPPQVIIP